MLVINHLEKIIRFGGSVHPDVLAGKVVPGSKGLTNGGLMLVPGVNEIKPEAWADVCARFPQVKSHYLANDHIEVVEDSKGNPVTADDLGKLKEKEAVKLVKNTADEKMLLGWLDSEKREGVLKAIENQLEALAKAGEPAKKDGEKSED